MKPIDPVAVKQAIKNGQLKVFCKDDNIYLQDTDSEETVKIGEIAKEQRGYSEGSTSSVVRSL